MANEIKPEQVPDEAYRAFLEAFFADKGGRAGIAAALNAWPGMLKFDSQRGMGHNSIFLPLPQEKPYELR